MYNRIVTVVPTLVPGLILLACLAGLTGTALADASSGRDAWRYNLSVATFHLPETGLDAGGKTALTTYHFQAGVKRRITRGAAFGLELTTTADFQARTALPHSGHGTTSGGWD